MEFNAPPPPPPWLETLLATVFFNPCTVHTTEELDIFCVECGKPLCVLCQNSHHENHGLLKILSHGYFSVVKTAEIQNILEIDDVQTTLTKLGTVVYLHPRPVYQMRSCNKCKNLCQTCKRSGLGQLIRFCCIACKVTRINWERDPSFAPEDKNADEQSQIADDNINTLPHIAKSVKGNTS